MTMTEVTEMNNRIALHNNRSNNRPKIPDDGTGSGKILNPTVLLLQREQRNRRLW